MGNLLNTIIANQSINKPVEQGKDTAFTFDSTGKVKPMEDKARLLPSRIFGSPIEYAKDLKQDVVNIKKAAKGQANDHELGRINDLAMKLGSLGLATYLFIKNPLKMSKTMEFVGFGTFFGAMSLWPKLTIQAPLKARTGVDIHQKYIDSQNRKKMVFQDPQYVLTDLYSKEDLEKMGDKLGVSKDLPDRERFIKQRAQKTALQGNTLWMMTAGVATPTASALMCNRMEKPVRLGLEKLEMAYTSRNLENVGLNKGIFSKIRTRIIEGKFKNYLIQNADKYMDENMIEELAAKLGGKTNSAIFKDAVTRELELMKKTVTIDNNFVEKALEGVLSSDILQTLSETQKEALNNAIQEGSLGKIANIISSTAASKHERKKLQKVVLNKLMKAKTEMEVPKVSEFSNRIMSLFNITSEFTSRKTTLDKFISARVGDKSGSYIANQWDRVGERFLKSLNLNNKDLMALSEGNESVIADKLTKFVSGENGNVITKLLDKIGTRSEKAKVLSTKIKEHRFNTSVRRLMKLINKYEETLGSKFTDSIEQVSREIFDNTADGLMLNNFVELSETVKTKANKGTVEGIMNINSKERIVGAKSSFYRLIQTLDVFKRAQSGNLKEQLVSKLEEIGKAVDDASAERLVQVCKDIMLNSTTTDYVEKLSNAGFDLSKDEYQAVMSILFGENSGSAIKKALKAEKSEKIMSGFNSYKKEFMDKVANWKNNITVNLSRKTVDAATDSANAVERNNLVGKPIKSLLQDVAKQKYNSNKWLKIFGTTFAILTAVTLGAGLLIGRKGKIEKQAEAESKVNG